MKDKRGMTLIEIIVSLALISVVIVFLMNLFVSVRGVYNNSKMGADYDLIVANIVEAVSEDISTYGLESIQEITKASNHSAYLLTFHAYRPSRLSEKIQKVLRVYSQDEEGKVRYYINYTYNTLYDGENYSKITDLVSNERITNFTRAVPVDAILDGREYIHKRNTIFKEVDGAGLVKEKEAIEIKIPIQNSKGTIYNINIYAILTQ